MRTLLIGLVVVMGCGEEHDNGDSVLLTPQEVQEPVGASFTITWEANSQGKDLDFATSTLQWVRDDTDFNVVVSADAEFDSAGNVQAADGVGIDFRYDFDFDCVGEGSTTLRFEYEFGGFGGYAGSKTAAVTCGIGSGLDGTDPTGDQTCPEDPDATPPDAMDITRLFVVGASNLVVATTTFAGDVEQYNTDTTDDLPFSLQLWLQDDTYIEAFFEDKDNMKVADGKAGVSHVFGPNELEVTLTGIDLDDVARARVSTFAYSFGDYSGSCDDELELTR